MCELHFHNFVFPHDKKFNLVPYIGYIHPKAFVSHIMHQVRWKLAYDIVKQNKKGCPLSIQVEHFHAIDTTKAYNQLLIFLGRPKLVESIQDWVISQRKKKVSLYEIEYMTGSQMRWHISSIVVRRQQYFGYPNFS